MAVDEALLESATSGVTTLRFYQWSEPTLSLGYFQSRADREQHWASLHCPLVRRASGGGAILHDCELTYSFAAPVAERFAASVERLYSAFHETLIEALAEFDIQASVCERSPARPRSAEPFLCFQRRSRGDVLLGESKICGSAQRRRRGAVVQHGSVLLRRSAAAPELAGISELTQTPIEAVELGNRWRALISTQLLLALGHAELTEHESERASTIAREQFSAPEWLDRR
jgi:lipoate-protein ligase A